jgi:hypothetical protein
MRTKGGASGRSASVDAVTLGRTVERCAKALHHSSILAELAASSPHPEEGAAYLLDTIGDLSDELRILRAALRRRS